MADAPQDEGLTTLEMAGPITRAEVARWRDALREALAGGDDARLDLSGAGPWDLSGLQLLLSASATAQRRGSGLKLAGVPEALSCLADRAGLRDRIEALIE